MKNYNAITRQRADLFTVTAEKNLVEQNKRQTRKELIIQQNRQSLIQAVSTIIFVIVVAVAIGINIAG